MVPSLNFIHTHVGELNTVEHILSTSPALCIKEMQSRYALISHKGDKSWHDCVILDICKDDILWDKCPNSKSTIENYNKLIETYGESVVDAIIIPDPQHIMNKIKDVIDFAFDKVYKTDEIIVLWPKYKTSPDEVSSVPGLIYAVLQTRFHILSQYDTTKTYKVKIKKRERN